MQHADQHTNCTHLGTYFNTITNNVFGDSSDRLFRESVLVVVPLP